MNLRFAGNFCLLPKNKLHFLANKGCSLWLNYCDLDNLGFVFIVFFSAIIGFFNFAVLYWCGIPILGLLI